MHGTVMTERRSNFAVTLVAVHATLYSLFVCIDILKEATDWNVYTYCTWLASSNSTPLVIRDCIVVSSCAVLF